MEKKKSTKRISFVLQNGIESCVFLVCYLIGALRMIFFLNRVSDEGIAHYAYAFEFYNLLYIITSLAMSRALTKLVAIKQAKGQYKNREKYFRYGLVRAVLLSILAGLIVFFASDILAETFFKQYNVALAVKCLGTALVPAAFMAAFGGYLRGMGLKMPVAIAQITEQLVNLLVTMATGGVLFGYGSKVSALLQDETKKNAFGAAAGAFGVFAGALCAALFLLLILFLFRPMLQKERLSDTTKAAEHYTEIGMVTERTALFPMLSLLLTSAAVFVNQVLYFHLAKGKEQTLTAGYGTFYGKVRVFLFLPVLLAILMQGVLTGQLRKILKKDDVTHAKQRIEQSLRELMVLLIPIAVFLGVLAEPVFSLCYKGKVQTAVSMMHFGVIYIILFGILAVTGAVLDGMAQTLVGCLGQGIGFIAEVLSFALFFVKAKTPVYGLVYAMILGVCVQLLFNCAFIVKKLRYKPELFSTFLIPTGASAIMGGIDFCVLHFLGDRLGEIFTLCICLILSVVIYLLIIMVTAVLKEHEFLELPFGRYVVMLGRMLGLMK